MFNLIKEILRENQISVSQWQAHRLRENSCSLRKNQGILQALDCGFMLHFALATQFH